MELHLGIMNNAELAEWFGVKEGSFKTTKAKKLEVLKNFADFEAVGGAVNIKEIYIPVYSKEKSKAFKRVQEEVDKTWNENGLDSCKRVSLQIQEKLENELALSESTYYKYTIDTRNELYGKPFQNKGKLGSCTYQWCKKEGEGANAVLVPFSAEEEEVKNNLIKKYFGNTTEKQLLVKGMVEMGEITKAEAWSVLENMTNMNGNFMAFLVELQSKLNCKVIRGTYVERNLIGVHNWED